MTSLWPKSIMDGWMTHNGMVQMSDTFLLNEFLGKSQNRCNLHHFPNNGNLTMVEICKRPLLLWLQLQLQHENRSSLHETLAVWFSLAEAGKRKRVEKSLIRRLYLLVSLFLIPYRSSIIFFVWQSRENIPFID